MKQISNRRDLEGVFSYLLFYAGVDVHNVMHSYNEIQLYRDTACCQWGHNGTPHLVWLPCLFCSNGGVLEPGHFAWWKLNYYFLNWCYCWKRWGKWVVGLVSPVFCGEQCINKQHPQVCHLLWFQLLQRHYIHFVSTKLQYHFPFSHPHHSSTSNIRFIQALHFFIQFEISSVVLIVFHHTEFSSNTDLLTIFF